MTCVKVTVGMIAVFFVLLAIGLSLSLFKEVEVNDLIGTNKTIYYNGEDITVLAGGVFDLRNYNRFEITLVSRAMTLEYYIGYASMCQARCSPKSGMSHVLNAMTIDHSEEITITRHSPQHHGYLKLIDTMDDTPSLYLLKRSEVSFRLDSPELISSSEVMYSPM